MAQTNHMNTLLTLGLLFLLAGVTNAYPLSVTASVNASTIDMGQSINIDMSVSQGGGAPYYFDIYAGNAIVAFVTPSNSYVTDINHYNGAGLVATPVYTANYIIKPALVGLWNYTIEGNDATGNKTRAYVYVQVNASPMVTLYPNYTIIAPFNNITFTNSTVGGSKPFNFSYNVSGGLPYTVNENVITFNGVGLYTVKLIVNDSFGQRAVSLPSVIETGYMPTSNSFGNCVDVLNMSSEERYSVTLQGQPIGIIEDYIALESAAVTIDGNYVILNYTGNVIESAHVGSYSVGIANLSWAPILHTIALQICEYVPPTTTTSTSTTSTSTSTSTTKTSTKTTTKITTKTTTKVTTMPSSVVTTVSPATTIPASSSGSGNGLLIIAAIIVAVMASSLVYKFVLS